MRLECFTVFDKAVGAFLQPFFVRSKGEALRSFTDACADEKSNFRRYPDDYVLFYAGSYDDNTGLFTQSADLPARVVSARECLPVDVAMLERAVERQSVDQATFGSDRPF